MKISNGRQLQQIGSNYSSDINFRDFMKLYKNYTKEAYSFLLNDNPSYIHEDLGRTYYKMNISEKIKAINNKIEKIKAQDDLEKLLRFQLYHQGMLINMNF